MRLDAVVHQPPCEQALRRGAHELTGPFGMGNLQVDVMARDLILVAAADAPAVHRGEDHVAPLAWHHVHVVAQAAVVLQRVSESHTFADVKGVDEPGAEIVYVNVERVELSHKRGQRQTINIKLSSVEFRKGAQRCACKARFQLEYNGDSSSCTIK
eukprot:711620-Pyramimonas_sp.AAC.1